MSRPEHISAPELFYDDKEAGKYTSNSRIILVQTVMAQRCLELLNLAPDADGDVGPRLLLDVGCGSGLSGEVLSDAGHTWVGLDISPAMLDVAVRREVEGDTVLADMGQGFGFRAGMFDGAISVSALQWLFYSDKRDHRSMQRLTRFFSALYRCLRRGARAALQIYPESGEQLELVTSVAVSCGFTGGLVTDYPNSTKAKKHYLCLFAGRAGGEDAGAAAGAASRLPAARGVASRVDGDSEGEGEGEEADGADMEDERMTAGGASRGGRSHASAFSRRTRGGGGEEGEEVVAGAGRRRAGVAAAGDVWAAARAAITYEPRRDHAKRAGAGKARRTGPAPKTKDWIEAKRQARIAKGLDTRKASKYTGRKRSGKLL